MKNLLVISYFFPPLGGPGVQRIQKFVKYLPQNGWNPIIITVKNIEYIAFDHSLWEDIKNTEVHRTGSFDLMRLLFLYQKRKKFSSSQNNLYISTKSKIRDLIRNIFPIDQQIGWLPFAAKKGIEICRIKPVEVVYATITPFTSALIGYKIAKKCNKKLILDYRDLWQGKPDIKYFTKWHKQFSVHWERKILHFASKVIINTNSAKEKIIELYPDVPKEKFTVLYNGFDTDDFSKNEVKYDVDKSIFTYVGGFYGERTPKYFLTAIKELAIEKELPDFVEIRFIGNYISNTKTELSDINLRKWIKLSPQVEHNKSVKYLLSSDVLLLFIAQNNSEFVIPAKLFEYFAARKPILAMIPPNSEAAELIRKYNVGEICQTNDIVSIKRSIKKMVKYHQEQSFSKKYDLKNNYNKYERSFQAKALAEIIRNVAK